MCSSSRRKKSQFPFVVLLSGGKRGESEIGTQHGVEKKKKICLDVLVDGRKRRFVGKKNDGK